MPKSNHLQPEYVSFLPEILVEGKLYISKQYGSASHLCACGCGAEIVTPLSKPGLPPMWELTEADGKVSLSPSIGNFQIACKRHYFIRENQIVWL